MSRPRYPRPAQPLLSVFGRDWEEFWPELLHSLERKLGPADHISSLFPFTETGYYQAEMGSPLYRRIVAFQTLLDPQRLVEMKLACNELEEDYLRWDGSRRVNLDPGLLFLERLVLATGKDFTHRIYLGEGIWVDLTLIYQHGGWQTLPWTYPDYAGERVQSELREIRRSYKAKLRQIDDR